MEYTYLIGIGVNYERNSTMRSLAVYDSAYGNTAKVARAIHASLEKHGASSLKMIADVTSGDLQGIDILVIGSPTQGGRPTIPTQEFIDNLPKEVLKKTGVAIFDTRFESSEQKLALRILMGTIGYAAEKMAKSVQQRGGKILSEPQGFIVSGKEGPLKEEELERASTWAAKLAQT